MRLGTIVAEEGVGVDELDQVPCPSPALAPHYGPKQHASPRRATRMPVTSIPYLPPPPNVGLLPGLPTCAAGGADGSQLCSRGGAPPLRMAAAVKGGGRRFPLLCEYRYVNAAFDSCQCPCCGNAAMAACVMSCASCYLASGPSPFPLLPPLSLPLGLPSC